MVNRQERDLPIFPLSVVYFPGLPIRLRVFEERYKLMLADIQPLDSMFGVVLIKQGREVGGLAIPHEVGTVAKITKAESSGPGRISVAADALERFRMIQIIREKPYMIARVELLGHETESGISDELLDAAKTSFQDYLQCQLQLAGGWTRSIEMSSGGVHLSYLIADSIANSPYLHQQLLEIDGPATRLRTELELLREATEALKKRIPREGPLSGFSSN